MSHKAYEETILVIAKTYPELSEKYGCLVCVAGINEDGEWRRLYPIPYTLFYEDKYRQAKFKKFDFISVKVDKAQKDPRYESYKVIDPYRIRVIKSMDSWDDRRKMANKYLDEGFDKLNGENRSLGIIKPRQIRDFILQERQRIEDEGERTVLEKSIQTLLPEFPETKPRIPFMPAELPWIGYDFLCYDEGCRGHKMMCIDWEIQELYRKLGQKEEEGVAFRKTRQKALIWMLDRDLYFCVGTTWRFPSWMVISLIYPPKV